MDQTTLDFMKCLVQLVTVIGGIIGTFVAAKKLKVDNFIETKTNSIKDAGTRDAINNSMNHIDTIIATYVMNAEKKLKPQILAMIADGKITQDELNNLTNLVKNDVFGQLGEGLIQTLKGTVLNDISDYIEKRVILILEDIKKKANVNISQGIVSLDTLDGDTSTCDNNVTDTWADEQPIMKDNSNITENSPKSDAVIDSEVVINKLPKSGESTQHTENSGIVQYTAKDEAPIDVNKKAPITSPQ